MTEKVGEVAATKSSVLEAWFGVDSARMIRQLFTNPLSVIGMILLGLFLLVAIAAPVLAPPRQASEPYQIPRDGYSPNPQPPGTSWDSRQPPLPFWWKPLMGTEQWTHLLGTASGQWDIYYGLVWGTRTALRVGLLITLCTATFGILIGSVSAYYGGWFDMVLMRITDVFMAFPFLLAALTLSAILTPVMGKGLFPAMAAVMVFGWMGFARLIRSDILSVKQREYVMAAQVIGSGDGRIMLRHILPNAIFPTLVLASMNMGSYVLTFAALSFLGVGAEVGYADWGQLISFARDWVTNLADYWYIVIYPGMALVFFVLAWNLVGDALRDVLDPRLRGTR